MITPPQPHLVVARLRRPIAPARAVARPGLIARLNEGLAAGRLLTLIAAPAGYGKTTLAVQWAAQVNHPVAWLSLDEADDDPLRFCTYFVAALQTAAPSLGAELTPVLAAGQPPPPAALAAALLNDLAAVEAGPILCILDDFHAIQDPFILALLENLLMHPPTGLHLALVTREDPALPLARLRARNQLTEVRAADLRFSQAEAAALLRDGMGLSLTDPDLAHLAERTEGWVAGLHLAGLSLQGRSDPSTFVQTLSGSHRFILSYLTEEVLARQPGDVQEFLLQTSILDRLTGDLCDAVTGRRNSAALLERLFTANLFLISEDDEARWYRYHRLFAGLLQSQLRRRSPEQMAELHRRAGLWHAAHNSPATAIDHALAAGDYRRVVEWLERSAWALLNQGYARKLEAWWNALPPEHRSRSLRLTLDFGWMRLLRGALEQVEPLLEQAEASLTVGDSDEQVAGRSEWLALRANWLQAGGRHAEAIEAAHQALEIVPSKDARVIGLASLALGGAYRQLANFERSETALRRAIQASRNAGDRVTETLATAHLALMATQYGRLRLAASVAAEAIQRLTEAHTAPPILGALHGALGRVYYEWNDLQAAQDHLEQGVRLSALAGHNASTIYTLCALARLFQAAGKLEEAGRCLDEAAALLAQGAPGWVRPELIARQVGLALAQGDAATAEMRLRAGSLDPEAPVDDHTEALHLAWLRLFLVRGDARAADLAQRIIAAAEAGGRQAALIQALLLAAQLEADPPSRAAAHLRRALALAEPEGFVRVFLDEGPTLAALLQQLGPPPWLAHVIPAARHPSLQEKAMASLAPERTEAQWGDVLFEPLSARETEVLRLLAEGLTYAEIAERLVVSLNTVRFHVKEIYGKLGVNRRTQAVRQAQELGLL